MAFLACIVLLATLTSAWDPVRPGALVKKLGDVVIINQSVRVVLEFSNITTVRENVKQISEALDTVKLTIIENNIQHEGLEQKIQTLERKLEKINENFIHHRQKRAVGMAIAIGTLVGLGVTNLGLYADMRINVNNLQKSLSRVDTLQEETEEIKMAIDDITIGLETLNKENSFVRDSLALFLILDNLHHKLNELDDDLQQLISDLVMANSGLVTSTLLSVHQLINITMQAKLLWNFTPFFNANNIILYYPILNSFINGTGVIIDIPFSSEFKYNLFNIIPFPMNINNSTLIIDTDLTPPMNYILSTNDLRESSLSNDNLLQCKKTDHLYLCSATFFTFKNAFNSCESSLVKNTSILKHCHFQEAKHVAYHASAQGSHFVYFANMTTVSVSCPGLPSHVESIKGQYSIPEQCELHSSAFSTIANTEKILQVSKDQVLSPITIVFSSSHHPIKIRKLHKLMRSDTNHYHYWYLPLILTPIILALFSVFIYFSIKKHAVQPSLPLRHVSSPR